MNTQTTCGISFSVSTSRPYRLTMPALYAFLFLFISFGSFAQSGKLVKLDGLQKLIQGEKEHIQVINFWATWCAPCREEIPLLVASRQKYGASGVEVVGIAIDNAAKVREFSATFKISYPVLLAEAEGLDLMRRVGNTGGGLPYTVITDRQGKLQHRKLGALKQDELDRLLAPMVRG